MSTRGLLLFAHGARDPAWALPFEAVCQRVRALSSGPVRLAYLEFMDPGFGEAVDDLVALGSTEVDIVPLFLGAGGHVRKDVPGLIEQARVRHPGLVLKLHPAAGEAPAVIEALALTALACAGGDGSP